MAQAEDAGKLVLRLAIGLLLEVQWLYLLGAIAVALLGARRFSVGGAKGLWN